MKIVCNIEIDLEKIQEEYKNQLLNNCKIYEYVSKNITKSSKLNVTFQNIDTMKEGNRGFLNQLLEEFNHKA